MEFVTGPHTPIVQMASQARTIGEMFLRQVERVGPRNAFFHKPDSTWEAVTWDGWLDTAARVAGKLADLGLEAGDRLAILGPTQPQWAYCDMGAQLAGIVSVGLYPMQTPEQLRYIIGHSESRVVFVDSETEIRNVLEACKDLDHVEVIVPWSMGDYDALKDLDSRMMPWTEFLGDRLPMKQIQQRLDVRSWDHTALFIYTSGTTGPPKGAMITHAGVLQLLAAMGDQQDLFEDDLSLSFLPMAHAAERNLAYYGRISSGMATAYASSVAAVLDELQEVQPTVFGSVPRIFEKAYARIQSEIEKKPAAVQKLFAWACDVGAQVVRLQMDGRRVPFLLDLQYQIASRLVFQKVRDAFGGRIKQFVTGAAPIAIEIMEFFWAAGMPIYEAYGMTEATVCTHLNRPGETRLGTVGRPIAPIQQKIAEDGEILVRGPWVFEGYFKNETATAETIVDGWLHTGDIGAIDADGYLRITDRKKHLIITAGGKNLAPANIENAIKNESPLISQVHAHGDRRKFVSALIAPSPIETLEWGVAHKLMDRARVDALTQELLANPAARPQSLNDAMAEVVQADDFLQEILAAVQRGNEKLANVEKVKRVMILERDFSQEEGELTPTMKVKRRELEQKFAEDFDRLYEGTGHGYDV